MTYFLKNKNNIFTINKKYFLLCGCFFAISCNSSKPIVSSSVSNSPRTLNTTITSSFFQNAPGYKQNAAIYNAVNLGGMYSYTSSQIGTERLAGNNVTVGVVDFLGMMRGPDDVNGANNTKTYDNMPILQSMLANNISESYYYLPGNSNPVAKSLQTYSSSAKYTATQSFSAYHANSTMSLIAAKKGDQTYSAVYNTANDFLLPSFDLINGLSGLSFKSQTDKNMHGVAYNAKIIFLGIDMTSTNEQTNTFGSVFNDFVVSTKFLIQRGVKVVNASLGYDTDSSTSFIKARSELSKIINENDVMIVAAAGNTGNSDMRFPAFTLDSTTDTSTYKGGIISVASTDYDTTQISSFSTTCEKSMSFCLTAPGNFSAFDSSASNYAVANQFVYYYNNQYFAIYSEASANQNPIQYLISLQDGRVYSSENKAYNNLTNARNKVTSTVAGVNQSLFSTIITNGTLKEGLVSQMGTSSAAPIVSGILANIKAAFPGMLGKSIIDMTLLWAKPTDGVSRTQGQQGELSTRTGWGMIDGGATIKAINESKFGYTSGLSSNLATSLQYTALSASSTIGNSVGAINNALSNVVFSDTYGNSFLQSLSYKAYNQNGYGGYTNQYNGSTSYINPGKMTDFYSNFFTSNSQNNTNQIMQTSIGTTFSFNNNNRYENQGSFINLNDNKLTKGFAMNSQYAQSPYSYSKSFGVFQNFGKLDFGYAQNSSIGSYVSSFMNLANSGSFSKSYRASYNLSSNSSFTLTSAVFKPFGYNVISEFRSGNFDRKINEFTFQKSFQNSKTFYTLSFGNMSERGAFLTTLTNGAFYVDGANTGYLDVNLSKYLGSKFSIIASTSVGSTNVNTVQNSIFSRFSNLITTSHSFYIEKDDAFVKSTKFTNSLRFGLKLPISVVKGNAVLFDGNNYQTISLNQSAREVDYDLSYRLTSLSKPSSLYISLIHAQNFANIKGLENNYAMLTLRKTVD